MAKRQKYLAAITKNGIPEGLFFEWAKDNPEKTEDWKKRVRNEEQCSIEFKEMSESEIKKGLDKYEKYFLKRKALRDKEMEKIKAKAKEARKEEIEPEPEEKPKKSVRKKKG